MNNSIFAPKWASALAAVALVALLIPCPQAAAYEACVDDRNQTLATISANDAKRVVRRYLADLGYTLRIGPGGARILSVSRDGLHWAVSVLLSNGSSVQSSSLSLYVRIDNGRIETPGAEPRQVAAR